MTTTEQELRLARSRHRRIFYRPEWGNAGDALINEGFYDTARAVGLEYTEILNGRTSIPEAGPDDLVVMSGGGALSSHWDFGSRHLTELTAGRAPLLVLPQSLDGETEGLRSLRPQDTLFVRDLYSLEIAHSLDLRCEVHLDHDMAIHVDVPRVLREGHVRIPRTRDDARRAAAFARHRILASRGHTLYAWRQDNEASRESRHARRRDDLSMLADFGTTNPQSNHDSARALLTVVQHYPAVETDRLHVGIGAALVGTPVRMHSNAYHKIRGVYEYSLSTDPRFAPLVTFVGDAASPGAEHGPAGSPLRGPGGE